MSDSIVAKAHGDKELGDHENERLSGKTERSSLNEKSAGDGTVAVDPAYALDAPAKGDQVAEEQAGTDTEAEDESKYPGGFALGILTFGLCMATFVVALDNTIIGELSGSLLLVL